MPQYHDKQHLTDEDRRDFLKALGVGSAVAVGSFTLDDVREALAGTASASEELAPIGQAIQSDLAGALDADLLASQQADLIEATEALPAAIERGLPDSKEPRQEFERVAAAGRPVYKHLGEVGFFKSTTKHLPPFMPAFLEENVQLFVESEALAEPFADLGLSEDESVDTVATVIANVEQLKYHHWVASPKISRENLEDVAFVPPMTQAAAGGALLWLADLDEYLWTWQTILTAEILADAVWHSRAIATGFQLMTEGARTIAESPEKISTGEFTALLSIGFAVQAISQSLLPQDVHWITEEMRAERRTDLEPIIEMEVT